ncbi:MAG: DNA gyrase/topoisomerase IV subunit A [bacterium]
MKIIETDIVNEIKNSYVEYSLSVLLSRALPDVRDGLKPVQRRILYAMYDMNLLPNKQYKKCASIVGEVLGKYHPHGDTSVYEALVRLAQDFSLNYPLILGQGNFGSIDGDPAAAYRYTEAKLSEIGILMLKDIEENTVDFKPNFDNSYQEPVILPALFPNLLVNGSMGIAVGMATNIPPHNLKEVIDALIYLIDNPKANVKDILEFIKGPDFPTGGVVYTSKLIKSIYSTGKGILKVEGKYKLETINKKQYLVIYEIPYSVNKSKLVREIAEAIKDKKLPYITDIIDQSSHNNIRILLELRNDLKSEEEIVNYLRNFTSFRISFSLMFIAVNGNIPKQYNILELLIEFLNHRIQVIKRKIKNLLEKSSYKAFMLKALIKATSKINEVIQIIKESQNYNNAKENLMKFLSITDKQAQYILQLQLQRLTKLEIDSLQNEYKLLLDKIKEYSKILEDENKIKQIIKEELLEISNKYSKERKTLIADKDTFKSIDLEKEIPEENLLIISTNDKYLYSIKPSKFEKILLSFFNTSIKINNINIHSNKELILGFLNNGKLSKIDINKIDEKGIFVSKIFKQNNYNLNVIKTLSLSNSIKNYYILVLTKYGLTKLIDGSELNEFNRIQTYIKISPNESNIENIHNQNQDEVIFIDLFKKQEIENKYIIVLTNNGYLIKIKLSEIPVYSKIAKGVLLIQLKQQDYIIYSNTIDISLLDKNYLIILDKDNNLIEIDLNSLDFFKRGRAVTKKEKIIEKEIKSIGIINTKLAIVYNIENKIDFIYDYKDLPKLKETIDIQKNMNFIEINKNILKKIYQ